MDPHDFLSKFTALAALHRWAEHVEEKVEPVEAEAGVPAVNLPIEGALAFSKEHEAGNEPKAYLTEDAGVVIISDWKEYDEHAIRLVCWSECGEKEFMGIAAEWWKANNPAWQEKSLG